MPFRAGDLVHHQPSGTTHALAADERDGLVVGFDFPSGGAAFAKDCRLARVATDEGRVAALLQAAKTDGDGYPKACALADLAKMGIRPDPPAPATRWVCAGAACRCSLGNACECVEKDGGCINCGRSMVLVDVATGEPIQPAVDGRQGSLF